VELNIVISSNAPRVGRRVATEGGICDRRAAVVVIHPPQRAIVAMAKASPAVIAKSSNIAPFAPVTTW
jgi:hypothetical protein